MQWIGSRRHKFAGQRAVSAASMVMCCSADGGAARNAACNGAAAATLHMFAICDLGCFGLSIGCFGRYTSPTDWPLRPMRRFLRA